MNVKPVWVREDDLSSLVEIAITARKIPSVRNVLRILGVPEVGPEGGHGFIIAEGAVSISGTHSACEKAVKNLLLNLNGPKFLTADQVYARQKKGAKA